MSQRDFSEVEPEGTCDLPAASRALFLEKVRQSNNACQNGDFATAVSLYTDALQLDPTNHILYSNRSAAKLKQGQFAQALQDAIRAREICPTWPKAYYRQGVALQCLGRHGEALAAFSAGLAQDPASTQLLAGLVEASIKSPLRNTLEPTFQQLQMMKLDQSPFVVISVVGQELLAVGLYHSAVTVLESALRIGSCSLKLRGSVFSALSSAHWALNQLDKAIAYMQQDLAIAKSLGDTAGECRAHGNLGSAYFSQGSYKEALTAHRYQLVLAMKCKDTQAAASALTSLGHVYTAIGDYPNALASHKQCVQLVKQMGDRLQEAREIGNVGAVYLAMGDFDSAVDCHTQHLRIARRLGNQVEEARAFSNLGSSHHYRRNFTQAIAYHENVLRIAQAIGDRAVEARAYAGLGHASRCAGDHQAAKRWHERQLDMALVSRDKIGEGRACSNLGIVYQLLGEYDAALKLHQMHLSIARSLGDRAGMGRAYGNIGNAYSAAEFYESAIKYHKQELTISKEVHDRSSEASTHGNLAVAYQALGAHDMALFHYKAHLGIARELKDTAGEACALLNLGNCLSSRSEFSEAIPYYEQYLMLSQELADIEGEAKACHFLGYAHYCIGNFREAVRYYDQDLALAKDLQDKMNMGRAYCNLGLAHLALGQLETSLECQKYFLAIAHMTQNNPGKFRALGNIGDVLIKQSNLEEALKMFQRQLALARSCRDRSMEAAASGALGMVNRLLRRFDKSLACHSQELALRHEISDVIGECKAHGSLGAVQMALGNYNHAVKCYQEQLERAQELQDCAVEAQAYGNMGIARLNMSHYEDAIGYFEQQLATLERLSSPTSHLDRGRAFGSLGDCYFALNDPEEAAKCHEQHLAVALKLKSARDQERAYRGLGQAMKSLGNLQQALVCLEKRLVVAHEVGSEEGKAMAYGELGQLHATLGNLEQAISCLDHQQTIARSLGNTIMEADAASGLGCVYQQMGEHNSALKHHQQDLELAERLGMPQLQGRACGNLGAVHESLGNFEQAIRYQEQHLSVAASTNDQLAKTLAYSSLGRIHQLLGNRTQAIAYLTQGLCIAESLGRGDEEARIRNRLGLALWADGDLEGAHKQLEAATQLLETIRRETRNSPDYKLSLFELQTSSYQILQRVLVALNRQEDALLVAERGRTRAFVDLLLERQGYDNRRQGEKPSGSSRLEEGFQSIEQLLDIVNRQRATILYYSLAAGFLYTWLIVPVKGIVKFQETPLNESGAESSDHNEDPIPSGSGLLERLVQSVRDSLGAEQQATPEDWSSAASMADDTESRVGFLRMVNRNHLLNSSNYSLSSLFSLGSVGGSVASLQGSTRSSSSKKGVGLSTKLGNTISTSSRSKRKLVPPSWQGPSCLHALYKLLIGPFEEYFESACGTASPGAKDTVIPGRRELILVLEGDLYLVPFPVLRSNEDGCDYLCERFSLIAVPSLSSLRPNSTAGRKKKEEGQQNVTALVVGNPKLPPAITDHYGWSEIPQAEQEAMMVAELLQTSALTGAHASKQAILDKIQNAECVHLATHVSWKLSSLVLSPVEMLEQGQPKRYYTDSTSDDDSTSLSTSVELPPLSDFLLSAADLLSLKLSARLIIISSSHTKDTRDLDREGYGYANSDGLVALVRALLAAGAQAVLVSLWPVPDTATKILLRAFYSALLQGTRAARALAEAMQTVQHTKHFAHPANWAGFLLIGANTRLSNKVALMGQALCDLLRLPDKCRDALRVTLHLVEKSLQRIHRGQKNAMYTTQKSIENKVGLASGWKELLMSVGFRFEPAANGIPTSVFFPQSDPEERLTQCSASLQALLGLSSTSLHALSKLTSNPEAVDDILGVIQQIISQLNSKTLEGVPSNQDSLTAEVTIGVRLWRVPGCHELFASLGLDLVDVGQDRVTLRTGKQANKRNVQFVLQALLALFDTQEAPKSLSIDSSSSLESLASIDNDFSHSDNELEHLQHPPRVPRVPRIPKVPVPLARVLIPGKRLGSGAFTSYVRHRGEPDGKTHSDPQMGYLPSSPQGVNIPHHNNLYLSSSAAPLTTPLVSYHPFSTKRKNPSAPLITAAVRKQPPPVVGRPGGGGESDAAFTPSPPVALQAGGSSHEVGLGLVHQSRIRTLYSESKQKEVFRPDSSSSASSATDWDSGHATVLRRQLIPPAPPPRAQPLVDLPKKPTSSQETDRTKPEEKLDEQGPSTSIHDTILATQLRHINRELTPTISDVYHERNIGLGLAPPLSKLLLNQDDGKPLQKHETKIFDEDPDLEKTCQKCPTGSCSCKTKSKRPWLSAKNLQEQIKIESSDLTTADILERETKKWTNEGKGRQMQNEAETGGQFSVRDEADGRSIADSQCSSSYNKRTIFSPLKSDPTKTFGTKNVQQK